MATAAAPQPTEARACHMTSDPTGPAVMAAVCPTPAARFHPPPPQAHGLRGSEQGVLRTPQPVPPRLHA